jgi:hypothetical protein
VPHGNPDFLVRQNGMDSDGVGVLVRKVAQLAFVVLEAPGGAYLVLVVADEVPANSIFLLICILYY